jgi:hypothetical protein
MFFGIRDPGSEIRDPGWEKIRIRDKHPGSATLQSGIEVEEVPDGRHTVPQSSIFSDGEA